MGKSIIIDDEKCDGCGLCVDACHEGVIELINGKAKATKAWLCDGIGDCLPACPQGAITFTEDSSMPNMMMPLMGQEAQWPIKLELVSDRNPFFDGKNLLIAADCSAFKRDVIGEYGKDSAVLIGCPKLAKVDEEKLCRIVANNKVKSVTVVRMEVPCCSPLAKRAEFAVQQSGKDIPFRTVVLRRDGTPQ